MLIQSLISSDKYSIKCPYPMNPIGVCIHNTANDAPAKNEISYMKSNNNKVSYHIAIDDKDAIQGIPFNRSAWHAGDGNGQGNRSYIGIEICYSKSGGEKFIEAEKRAAKEVAQILKSYNWGVDKVKAHRDFSNKNCPHRTNMTEFKNMVKVELDKLNNISNPSTDNKEIYRVRKSWDDTKTQIGAYSDLSNAKKLVDENKGYFVFDSKGNKVYPVSNNSNNSNNQGGSYMSKVYRNGSTPENVYSDEKLTNKIGSLDPRETCEAIADINGKIVVLYNTKNGKKTGFVKYRAGL